MIPKKDISLFFFSPWKKVLLVMTIGLSVSGCVTPEYKRVERIAVGQTKRQLLYFVGGPQSTSRTRGRDIWEYRYLGPAGEPMLMRVEIRDGKVESIQDGHNHKQEILAKAEAEDAAHLAVDQREFDRSKNGAFTPNQGNPQGTAIE